ncbi:gamma-glutamyltranspeptidase/glutathione hydrolase, partial [Isoptericola variabilis J7]|uniref:gamma-glutamyltransferase n=1 Tax=Isoptericola variabilis TaxID=139208 RepID=UPI0011AD50D0
MDHRSSTRSARRPLTAALAAALTTGLAVTTAVAPGLAPGGGEAVAAPRHEDKIPMAVGYGGAISTVDPEASRIGLEVLRKGGNAVDAAVAAAEPYSAGIGGGGFFLHYDAATGEVTTIDGRET